VVEVDNADLKLRPGMTANASIVIGEKQDVLKIPNAALRFRPPPDAVVTGATNTAASGDAKRMAQAPSNGGGGGGAERPNREEMRRRFESMSPEEREAFRSRMRGGGRQQKNDGPAIRTVYVFGDTNSASTKEGPALKAVTVRTGISDASFTEVLEGLKEGDVVVTGLNIPLTQTAAAQQRPGSPFGSPFGGIRPR
jgi:HlyD family secretion protein